MTVDSNFYSVVADVEDIEYIRKSIQILKILKRN